MQENHDPDAYYPPEVGSLVKYMGASDEQVLWGNHDDPRPVLGLYGLYHVAEIVVHSWHTRVRLEDVEGWFNSVHFVVQHGA